MAEQVTIIRSEDSRCRTLYSYLHEISELVFRDRKSHFTPTTGAAPPLGDEALLGAEPEATHCVPLVEVPASPVCNDLWLRLVSHNFSLLQWPSAPGPNHPPISRLELMLACQAIRLRWVFCSLPATFSRTLGTLPIPSRPSVLQTVSHPSQYDPHYYEVGTDPSISFSPDPGVRTLKYPLALPAIVRALALACSASCGLLKSMLEPLPRNNARERTREPSRAVTFWAT